MASVDIRGTSGLLVTYNDSGHSLVWTESPGVVAELVADGLTPDEVVEAARSLARVDEAAWAALAASHPLGRPGTDPPAIDADMALAGLCQARAVWLDGRATGDQARMKSAVDRLVRLRDGGQMDELAKSTDLVVILNRLVEAMSKGDVATVQTSFPDGGCGP